MELKLTESRRSVLRALAVAAAVLPMAGAFGNAQDGGMPKAPAPLQPEDEPTNLNERSPSKIRLQENQKDIKKDIQKLFELATQLKEQVEKTDATAVLSLAMLRKAEEIERLAHQIKERAKG